MRIDYILDHGAIRPTKAHRADAGFDLYSMEDKTIPAHGYALFDTGVHLKIPRGYVGFLKSKSGLNCKHSILGEGVIDSGYTGSIVVKLYNHSDEDYEVKEGDKINQIVILPIPEIELCRVCVFEDTERGNKGFGSSGR